MVAEDADGEVLGLEVAAAARAEIGEAAAGAEQRLPLFPQPFGLSLAVPADIQQPAVQLADDRQQRNFPENGSMPRPRDRDRQPALPVEPHIELVRIEAVVLQVFQIRRLERRAAPREELALCRLQAQLRQFADRLDKRLKKSLVETVGLAAIDELVGCRGLGIKLQNGLLHGELVEVVVEDRGDHGGPAAFARIGGRQRRFYHDRLVPQTRWRGGPRAAASPPSGDRGPRALASGARLVRPYNRHRRSSWATPALRFSNRYIFPGTLSTGEEESLGATCARRRYFRPENFACYGKIGSADSRKEAEGNGFSQN